MNDLIIKELQNINYEYKSSKDSNKKLQLLWQMGELLSKNNIVTQKEFWEMQSKGFYLNRSILLRSNWLRNSFTLEEIKKIRLPVSKLLEVLPYLATNSKKLTLDKKQELKKMILDNKLVTPQKNVKRKKEKKETSNYAHDINSLIKHIPSSEIDIFHQKFSQEQQNDLKLALFELLRLDLPTQKTKNTISMALELLKTNDCSVLSEIFQIIKRTADLTRIDSKKVMKITLDPQIMMPLLDLLFFNKKN